VLDRRAVLLADSVLGVSTVVGFPKKRHWLDGFRAAGLRFEDIDYVFYTHLNFDHCG
jgi:glyoxylase-like metal-dependent hydrolase (beta-lactamase superfamily II)